MQEQRRWRVLVQVGRSVMGARPNIESSRRDYGSLKEVVEGILLNRGTGWSRNSKGIEILLHGGSEGVLDDIAKGLAQQSRRVALRKARLQLKNSQGCSR